MSNLAEKVTVREIYITANRFGEGKTVNILPVSLELDIYENIALPYLTASLTILDAADIFGLAQLSGSEKIVIVFESSLDQVPIQKTFVVGSISSTKNNDSTAILVFSLIENIGAVNNLTKISKSYEGFGEEIIAKIVRDNFNQEIIDLSRSSLDIDSGIPKSEQSKFRYILPYITPFAGINTVLQKITTPRGLPFFFYSTISSNQLILKDLETILSTEPYNAKSPLFYSADTAQRGNDILTSFFNIDEYTESRNNEDTLSLAMGGAITSLVNVTDITSGEQTPFTVEVGRIVEALVNARITDQPLLLYDHLFQPNDDGRTIEQYTPAVINLLNTETFPGGPLGYNQEALTAQHFLKVVRRGILSHLTKNTFTISGPGAIMSTTNLSATVGNQISVRILNNVLGEGGQQEQIDNKRSGNFIITAKKISIMVPEDNHSYKLNLARVSNQQRIDR